MNEGLTVRDLTVSAIGCLIESFHSDGNDPMFTTKASIKTIIKKTINDGIKFYESANGVILSPGIDGIIPNKYFLSIEYL